MAHVYATFSDAALAEKAAGALLDYGVRKEDLSIVAHDAYGQTRATQGQASGFAAAAGDRLAQVGDRMAGAVAGVVGAPASAAVYDAAAMERAGAAENRLRPDEAAVGDADTYGDVSAYEVAPGVTAPDVDTAAKHGISTTTPEDAGEGAVKGTEIGLGVGILAGIASLIVPGVGLVLGGGALASALGAAALTAGAGALAGGVTGYLKEQGVPGEAAERYQGIVAGGGAVLNVNLPSGDVDQATAESVIGKYGATDLHSY